jgi:hypothetical protein
MLVSVNPLCGELPTGEPYAGEPHVRFGGRGDWATGLPYPYQLFDAEHFHQLVSIHARVKRATSDSVQIRI